MIKKGLLLDYFTILWLLILYISLILNLIIGTNLLLFLSTTWVIGLLVFVHFLVYKEKENILAYICGSLDFTLVKEIEQFLWFEKI